MSAGKTVTKCGENFELLAVDFRGQRQSRRRRVNRLSSRVDLVTGSVLVFENAREGHNDGQIANSAPR
jgi:hypothetical protein